MGKKNRVKKPSRGVNDVDRIKSTSNDCEKREVTSAQLFMTMQEKCDLWYRRERDGMAIIEKFQSAFLALRDVEAIGAEHKNEKGLTGLANNNNTAMDPWLVEELYQQVQELSTGFETLITEMYTLQAEAREIVYTQGNDDEIYLEATKLRPVDYFQMISHQLATFEAEYQHIEALLQLISFDISTDELQTLVISWSTSPFLEPEETRRFRQRHQLSNRLHT